MILQVLRILTPMSAIFCIYLLQTWLKPIFASRVYEKVGFQSLNIAFLGMILQVLRILTNERHILYLFITNMAKTYIYISCLRKSRISVPKYSLLGDDIASFAYSH
jgi:hypothetical protein